MLKRILSALVLIPVILLAVFRFSPLFFTLVVFGICALCFHEFLRMGRSRLDGGFSWTLFLAGLTAGFFTLYPVLPDRRAVTAAVFFLAAGALAVVRSRKPDEALWRLVWPVAGFTYVFGLFSWVYDIRFALDPVKGPALLLLFLLVQWLGDTFAYLFGRMFGKRKLCERVSPKKTVAGTMGGLLGSALAGAAVAWWAFSPHWVAWFTAAALFLGVAGQVGDLLESLLKRCCGVKDSSGLIPGHGGMLDRIDSLLFTAPLFYYLFGMVLKHA